MKEKVYPISYVDQFVSAISSSGMLHPETVVADGLLHRFPSDGKPGDLAGWYILHSEPIPAGAYGCWRRGISASWRINGELSREQQAEFADKVSAMMAARKADAVKVRIEALREAGRIWRASEVVKTHQYLERKRIESHGARLYGRNLVVPLRVGNDLHSLQFISPNGEKRFLMGGRTSGCYLSLHGVGPLCIVEGFATGASVSEAMGYPVAVAFSALNLQHVARELRGRVEGEILICADNDDVGRREAQEAALAVGAAVAKPPEGMDFNDLAVAKGLREVVAAFARHGYNRVSVGVTPPKPHHT